MRMEASKRAELEAGRRALQDQQRLEKRLSESVNGSVLATSNAERAFVRVKDSNQVTVLFGILA